MGVARMPEADNIASAGTGTSQRASAGPGAIRAASVAAKAEDAAPGSTASQDTPAAGPGGEAEDTPAAGLEDRDWDDDKKRFDKRAEEALNDKRIVSYFRLRLVRRDHVQQELKGQNAFEQARSIDAYIAYDKVRKEINKIDLRRQEIFRDGTVNIPTVVVALSASVILSLILFVAYQNNVANFLLILGSTSFGCSGGVLLVRAADKRAHRLRAIFLGVVVLTLSAACVVVPQYTVGHPLSLTLLSVDGGLAVLVGLLLGFGRTYEQCRDLINVCRDAWRARHQLGLDRKARLEEWLEASTEEVIMPRAVLIINTALGEDKDELLVEQDSEGLRRLLDPSFTVATRSEARVASLLSQMDGGSIALAGPRGAGKSTLLDKFSGRTRVVDPGQPTLSVYVSAPAEYVPRDFIAEVFQQLCEAYLAYRQVFVPDTIKARQALPRARRVARMAWGLSVLLLWVLAPLAVLTWVAWSFARPHYAHAHTWAVTTWDHERHRAAQAIHRFWAGHRLAIRVLLAGAAVLAFPGRKRRQRWRRWWQRARPPEKPPLAAQAREYLSRLREDKTITSGTSLSSPGPHGIKLGWQKGSSVRYVPWTLPELVRYARRFMEDVAREFCTSSQAVVVGIDEIDRIGSVQHAERFIGEIKAVFGIERCFFLVAVAEDVGSLFAQRATSGRSILENAFDTIISVEPLNLAEASDLLVKRVPGFTDSFVYLVHALSGGLPRELIRVSRRLVEVNQELREQPGHYPRLSELSVVLVREEVMEALRATRNQLSRLALSPAWTDRLECLRIASESLRPGLTVSKKQTYQIIEGLSRLSAPESARLGDRHGGPVHPHKASHIIDDLAAFAYFSLAVIDAFDEGNFSLGSVTTRTTAGPPGSYEELALARAELSVSTESSRSMLRRFRSTLTSAR